ncbi:hypothetical protein J6590_066313 [Homalodisca vitripennis]|nr:hypothetical protein J6590_066313 [Homalodisca vitripennis]
MHKDKEDTQYRGRGDLSVYDHAPLDGDMFLQGGPAPSNYHLFLAMKTWLATQHYGDDMELQESVTTWSQRRML